MEERRRVHSTLVRKLEGKRPMGRPNVDGDNIKMDLQEFGWACGEWMELGRERYR